MITYREEKFVEIREELDPLMTAHWQEVSVYDKEKFVINLDYDGYTMLCDAGKLSIVTARDEGELIGYYFSAIVPNQHYKDKIVSACDSVYLKPEYRKGMIGYKFLKEVFEILKPKVDLIFFNMRHGYHSIKMAERLGFRLTDYVFTMEV